MAQAKGKMVRGRIALDQAMVRLSETVVRAPIDGIILQKFVEEGQIISSGISNVSGGSPIADIANMKQVYIEAGIDEIDVGKIHIGQSAKVVAEAYPQANFEGQIIRIAPEAKIEQKIRERLQRGTVNLAVRMKVPDAESIYKVNSPIITASNRNFPSVSVEVYWLKPAPFRRT